MRENRTHGSEGGEAQAFPTPITRNFGIIRAEGSLELIGNLLHCPLDVFAVIVAPRAALLHTSASAGDWQLVGGRFERRPRRDQAVGYFLLQAELGFAQLGADLFDLLLQP